MENFKFENTDYYNRPDLDTKDKKPGLFARLFIKLGLGKSKDSATMWGVLIIIITIVVIFILID